MTPGRYIEALYSTPPGSAAMTKAGQPRPRDADEVGKGQRKDEEERQDLPDDCCTNLHDPSPVDELRPGHHQPKRRPSEPPSTNMLLPGVGAQANEPALPPSRCCLPAPPELSVGKKPTTPTKSRSNVQVQASAADAWPHADPETTRSCNPSVRSIPPLTAATNGERGLTRDGRRTSRTSEGSFGVDGRSLPCLTCLLAPSATSPARENTFVCPASPEHGVLQAFGPEARRPVPEPWPD